MAKIAYIDHSFHKTTLSTKFLSEILVRFGHQVDYFWDDSWNGGKPVTWNLIQDYDVIIMFQAYVPILEQCYRQLHPNVIFIPMLDQFGIWQGPLFDLSKFWKIFQGSKVISFSNAVHAMAVSHGIYSYFCRYYPMISSQIKSNINELHGFFWLRRQDQISWKTIKLLIANSKFQSLHLHFAQDPNSIQPEYPSQEDMINFNITVSTWFDDKSDFYKILEKANVFFCPRMEEGIGQAFLEALARGQCVVAPNHGTMNEYILHEINGLLFESSNPQPLCFDNVSLIGVNARNSVSIGREQWEKNEEYLVDYILTPSELTYSEKYTYQQNNDLFCNKINHYFQYFSKKNYFLRKIKHLIRS